MKRNILAALTVSLLSLVMMIYADAQEDMLFVDNTPFEKSRRPPAVFRHEEHNQLARIEACDVCHHLYDENGRLVEDESSEDQRCSDCHELEASGKKPALMKAFHTNCKGCHRSKNKGPTMCGQCHVKNPGNMD